RNRGMGASGYRGIGRAKTLNHRQYSPRRRGDTENSRGENKVKSKYKIKPKNSREHRDSLKKSKTINHRGQATGEIGASGHRKSKTLNHRQYSPRRRGDTEKSRGKNKVKSKYKIKPREQPRTQRFAKKKQNPKPQGTAHRKNR